jgi:rhodanese-related sulfurtransferase
MEFVKNNILLIAVAFASGAMLLWPFVRRQSGGPWVNTVEATQLINREDGLVLDVREASEYAQGHILGARNLPLSQLEARAAELDKLKAKPVILCCASGHRSSRAVGLLKARGLEKVFNLSGGFGAWQQAGLPVEK